MRVVSQSSTSLREVPDIVTALNSQPRRQLYTILYFVLSVSNTACSVVLLLFV